MNQDLSKLAASNGSLPIEVEENIWVLGEIVNTLMVAVSRLQTLKEVEMNAVFKNMELCFPEGGVDFHKAKRLYEINLVKQALRQTKGHQSNAAKLLKMRTSTLNSIIKKHRISV